MIIGFAKLFFVFVESEVCRGQRDLLDPTVRCVFPNKQYSLHGCIRLWESSSVRAEGLLVRSVLPPCSSRQAPLILPNPWWLNSYNPFCSLSILCITRRVCTVPSLQTAQETRQRKDSSLALPSTGILVPPRELGIGSYSLPHRISQTSSLTRRCPVSMQVSVVEIFFHDMPSLGFCTLPTLSVACALGPSSKCKCTFTNFAVHSQHWASRSIGHAGSW